jgi:hypothetical protein
MHTRRPNTLNVSQTRCRKRFGNRCVERPFRAVGFTERSSDTRDSLSHWHDVAASSPRLVEHLRSWRFVKKFAAEIISAQESAGGGGGTDAMLFEILKLLLHVDHSRSGVAAAAKNPLEEYIPFCVQSMMMMSPPGAAQLLADVVCFAVRRLGDAGRGCLETSSTSSAASSSSSSSFALSSSGRGNRKASSPPGQEAAVVDNLVALLRRCWSLTTTPTHTAKTASHTTVATTNSSTLFSAAEAARVLSAVREALDGWRVTDTSRLLRHPRLPQRFISVAELFVRRIIETDPMVGLYYFCHRLRFRLFVQCLPSRNSK